LVSLASVSIPADKYEQADNLLRASFDTQGAWLLHDLAFCDSLLQQYVLDITQKLLAIS